MVQPSFEDNDVSKGDSRVYAKYCVIWWLLILVIKLHLPLTTASSQGKKHGAFDSLRFFSVLF